MPHAFKIILVYIRNVIQRKKKGKNERKESHDDIFSTLVPEWIELPRKTALLFFPQGQACPQWTALPFACDYPPHSPHSQSCEWQFRLLRRGSCALFSVISSLDIPNNHTEIHCSWSRQMFLFLTHRYCNHPQWTQKAGKRHCEQSLASLNGSLQRSLSLRTYYIYKEP